MKNFIILMIVSFIASITLVGCSTSSGIHAPNRMVRICGKTYGRYEESVTCGMVSRKDMYKLFNGDVMRTNIFTK